MSSFLKFRKYKKGQGKSNRIHPKLFVGENKRKFKYLGLTSSSTKGKHHKNLSLNDNTEKNNSNKAYLRKKIEEDDKTMFGDILKDFNLSDSDKIKVIEFLNKHKKS